MFPYSLPFQKIPNLKKPYDYPPPAMSFLWCLLSVWYPICPCESFDHARMSLESSSPICEQSKCGTTPPNYIIDSRVFICIGWRNVHASEWMTLGINEYTEARIITILRCSRVWYDRWVAWVVPVLAWFLILRFLPTLSHALWAHIIACSLLLL